MHNRLVSAVKSENIEHVEKLLFEGVDPNIPIGNDSNGNRVLHLTNNCKIGELLIKYGADINIHNMDAATPLGMAIINNKNIEFIDLLLKHNASLNRIYGNQNIIYTAMQRYISHDQDFEFLKHLLYDGLVGTEMVLGFLHSFPFNLYGSIDNLKILKSVDCFHLLLKIAVIRQFDNTYITLGINRDYRELNFQGYTLECIYELHKMRKKYVDHAKTMSFYDVLIGKADIKYNNAADLQKSIKKQQNYIYGEMLQRKVSNIIDRINTCNELQKLNVRFVLKDIILNYDCIHNILKYLCTKDLKSLLCASLFSSNRKRFMNNEDYVPETLSKRLRSRNIIL